MDELLGLIAYFVFHSIAQYLWRFLLAAVGIWLAVSGWNSGDNGEFLGGLLLVAFVATTLFWRKLIAAWKP